ncbi:UDP-3-O-(3-hydroxymyristoyl)glucosamine N-acyltransferase [bacterium 210820-DFI.6.37]|nr:UDP-3-O-(3-hydroxymyristoyl)glucosamine N-acyltransferase [bacterium 210820-DFI.6.37]
MRVRIKDILLYLDKKGVKYTKERITDDKILGFSSLFQYKEGTMTFIVPERNFCDVAENFMDQHIAFIILGRTEKLYNCFNSVIRVDNPRKVFFSIIEYFFDCNNDDNITGITSDKSIYKANSYISPYATIGENVKIGIGCVIEGDVIIGDGTEIHHNVVIRNKTRIGRHCMIHSGVIIGEYGFGYITDGNGRKTMLKHYGGVCIEDDVHIGDNCVIIRGTIDDTVIHKGVKLNTMVHIAHNDIIGENTIITTPAHICGSVSVGKCCHIAGEVIRNQRTIGDCVTVGLGAVVVNDIESNEVVVGNPAKKMDKK